MEIQPLPYLCVDNNTEYKWMEQKLWNINETAVYHGF